MKEKKLSSNKYVHCKCEKGDDILVGMKYFGIMNPIGFVISVGLVTFIFISSVNIMTKFGAFAILGLPWIIGSWADYVAAKKVMLRASHSDECSKMIARYAAVYGSLWSEFKIMQTKDDGKRLWR